MIIHRTIAAAALILTISAVQADELDPIEAQSIDLGGVFGTAYYTVEQDGFHVITTLVDGDKDGTPVRIHVALAPGRSVAFSTPGAVGAEPVAVNVERQGDMIVVVQGSPLSN